MDLFKIQHELIAGYTEDAWYRLKTSGPSFRYHWQYGTGPDGPFSYIEDEHTEHAVFREDPRLTMSWGMSVHDFDREQRLRFDWAEAFVDETVRPFWVDFFWNNALIDRVELCRVDGGDGTIPLPHYGLKVTHFEEAVAWLIYRLEDGPERGTPGQFLDTIEAERVRDVPRQGAGSNRSS